MNPINSFSLYFCNLRFIISSHLPSELFPSAVPTKRLHAYLLSPTCVTRSAHLILLDSNAQIISTEEDISWSSFNPFHEAPYSVHETPFNAVHEVLYNTVHEAPYNAVHEVPYNAVHEAPYNAVHEAPYNAVHEAPLIHFMKLLIQFMKLLLMQFMRFLIMQFMRLLIIQFMKLLMHFMKLLIFQFMKLLIMQSYPTPISLPPSRHKYLPHFSVLEQACIRPLATETSTLLCEWTIIFEISMFSINQGFSSWRNSP